MAEKITPKDAVHVAKLARLALPEERLAKLAGQLESILAFVDKLQSVDVTGMRADGARHACRSPTC